MDVAGPEGCDRDDDRVPAVQGRRSGARDRPIWDAEDREVIDGDIDQAVAAAAVRNRRRISPAAVEGVSPLCHAEDVAGLLLTDGCAGAGRDVAAVMNHEVIAGERRDAGGGV